MRWRKGVFWRKYCLSGRFDLDTSSWHHHRPVNERAHKPSPALLESRGHTRSRSICHQWRRDRTVSSWQRGRLIVSLYLPKPLLACNHGCVPLSVLHRGIRRHQLYSSGCFSGHFIREFVFRVNECRRWGLPSLLTLYSALIMHMYDAH